MEFFQVTAKCGHVGNGLYYKGLFYVKAENASFAAKIVRMMPRVKHHHKDAIFGVEKIGLPEFKAGKAKYYANPYFNCHNPQKQRLFWDEIAENVYAEPDFDKSKLRDNTDRLAKQDVLRRYYRKMDKFGKYLEE